MTPERYARVKEIFLAVDSLPKDKQTEALDRLCEGEQGLAIEVAKLLDHHDPEAAVREGQTVIQAENLQTIINDANVQARLHPDKKVMGRLLGGDPLLVVPAAVATIVIVLSLVVAVAADRYMYQEVQRVQRDHLRSSVATITGNLERWVAEQRGQAYRWGSEAKLRNIIDRYAELDSTDRAALVSTPVAEDLRTYVAETCGSESQFWLWNQQGTLLATGQSEESLLGEPLSQSGMNDLSKAISGVVVFQFPTRSSPIHLENAADPSPEETEDLAEIDPMMWMLFPVYDSAGDEPVGAMLVSNPGWFTEYQLMLDRQYVRGDADVFVVNDQGLIISRSRHAAQWSELGISRDSRDDGVTRIRIADPGGRLADGYRLTRSRRALPLTEAVARVTVGESALQLDGYSDVRGERVIGVWQWIDDLGVGAIVELDYDEAYEYVAWFRRVIGALLAIPLCGMAIAVFAARRLRTSSSASDSGAVMAGSYELLDKIGEGGMGFVYRARHSLLKRPSAVKLLRPDRLTSVDVGRFDREVKLAAQLTSPHTVEIFDYGRTKDGLIYFAMEFLDGLTLSHVVARSGALPAPRTLHFLIQLCKSIEEAHSAGLVHRDIKPQNIMITRRGNEADWLILFDFGLAKSVAPNKTEFRTRETIWSGTPMFMSPERVRAPAAVDPRMDIYAIGAVGYLLLTGHEPFTVASPEMVFEQILNVMPKTPTEAGATSIPQLDALLMRCLAKDPDDRPDSATQLRKALEQLAEDHPWTDKQANQWWQKHSRD